MVKRDTETSYNLMNVVSVFLSKKAANTHSLAEPSTKNIAFKGTDLRNEPQVLIAEDEYLIAASIRESILKYPQPLDVVIVQRGRMLVENLKQLNPDVLIMDINLRGLVDGIEAVKRIQQTRNIPIIYITADSRPATRERAQATQPVAYLTKPFKDYDLHEALSRALQRES